MGTKIAFVGQKTYFESASLLSATDEIVPLFVNYKHGENPQAMRERIQQFSPDLIIAFKPESFPRSSLLNLPGFKVGWFTEPLPRIAQKGSLGFLAEDVTGHNPKPDVYFPQEAEADLFRREVSLKQLDNKQFDYFISYDTEIVETLSKYALISQSIPLCVDDSFFAELPETVNPARVGFFGRPTKHRDLFLNGLLHEFEIKYIAHGISGSDLKYLLKNIDIAINLHNEGYPNFENRVPLHMAAGNLVLSEPLHPLNGLEPNIDFAEFRSPNDLHLLLTELYRFQDSFELMRIRGRKKAEYFRSSTVYGKLISTLNL